MISISIIFSIFIAVLGLDVGIHRCGGEVKSIALYGPAQPCSHAATAEVKDDLPTCHRHPSKEKEDSDKGCCEDEYFDQEVLEIQVIPDNSEWSALEGFDFSAELLEYDESLVTSDINHCHYLNYKPPLIHYELLVLQQSFLI